MKYLKNNFIMLKFDPVLERIKKKKANKTPKQ